ncbi:MAG: TetR family transcriptional regulator [Candidatus Dormibacteria bacterium]
MRQTQSGPLRRDSPAIRDSAAAEPQTADRILVAAADLFLSQGYARTTMAMIAANVGMTAPALYWHFSSKHDLAYRLLQLVLMDFNRYVKSSVVSDTPPVRLQQFVRAHVYYELTQLKLSYAYARLYAIGDMIASLSSRERRRLVGLQRQHIDLCKALIEDGVATGDFRVPHITPTALAIVTMCEHVVSWYRVGGTLTETDVADLHADLALRMVGN